MTPLRFHIVDVFAEEKYAGNQLAVVRDAAALSTAEMQRIAQEMHFSETSFILSETLGNGGFDVRIFTPAAEAPFAGHPTLGAAHVIRNEILRGGGDRVVLNLKVGAIPVAVRTDSGGNPLYWMRQIEPTFGRVLPREEVAAVLGLTSGEIDERFPIEEVSTGLPHLIVPLKSLAALQRIRIARDRYEALVRQRSVDAILVFCPEPHLPGNDVSVRMFAEALGVFEDPATGSGNGCLAAYLARHRFWGRSTISARSEQGHEIGRPSLLHLEARDEGGRIEVDVGGRVIDVARGELS